MSEPNDAEAIDLLHDLVSIASVSGEEGEASAFLCEWLGRAGLQATVDDTGSVVACTDPVRHPGDGGLVLLGHIDTVPGAIPVRIENGVLHGRGAVDAKGPLAAFCVAAARASEHGAMISVVGAVEEELSSSRGARAAAQRMSPDACIIGEPSGWDGVTLGYKGRMLVEYEIVRPCGHSAGPGTTPAEELTDWWIDRRTEARQLGEPDASPFESIQIALQEIATSSDGLHETARCRIGYRLPQWLDPRELESMIISHTPGARCFGFERAHASPRTDPVARALVSSIRETGARPRLKLKTGTSDMNIVAPVWNCPIAAYGPGDSSLDHTPEERIHLDEYLRSVEVLTRAVVELADSCASPCADLAGEA